ncbi:hypothetical protein ABPG74_003059 [Tetrahymena malaccensis]
MLPKNYFHSSNYFQFNDKKAKMYGTVEEPVFLIDDICEMLQIANNSQMIIDIKRDPKFYYCFHNDIYLPNDKPYVNERGLYEIVHRSISKSWFRSSSKLCEQFKDKIYDFLSEKRLDKQFQTTTEINEYKEKNRQLESKVERIKRKHQFDIQKSDRSQKTRTTGFASRNDNIHNKTESLTNLR